MTDTDCRGAPGAGAAGGVGFAASAVLGARVRPGIEMILDIVGLDRALLNAKMVLTGEGCLDVQSLRGKAPVGVSRRARRHGVPTFAVAGVAKLTGSQARAAGFVAVRALNEVEPDQRRCITNAADLLSLVTERLIRESTPAGGKGLRARDAALVSDRFGRRDMGWVTLRLPTRGGAAR